MICPKCDGKKLVPTSVIPKTEYTQEYYKCPHCGFIFIVRKNNKTYSEEQT